MKQGKTMTKKSKYGLISVVFFALAVVAMVATGEAHASWSKGDDAEANAEAKAIADAAAQAEATGGNAAADASGGDASNQLSVEGDSVENNSSNIVLVPNNNTERCLRVWGFAFGKDGDSAALGVPWRSAQCDYGQYASAADAQGNHDLGWYWRCHMRSAYGTFKDKGESKEQAIGQCHDRMLDSTAMKRTIEKLRDDLELLQAERAIERKTCSEAKNRIVAGCYGEK